MLRALKAEVFKLRRSTTPLWSAFIVLCAPFFCWVLVDYTAGPHTWGTFMDMGASMLSTWYGIMLFALVTAYVFGREYVDGTVKDLLTQPVRRESFLAAKGVVAFVWLLSLTVLSVVAQAGFALALGLKGASSAGLVDHLVTSLKVAALLFATTPIVALLAIAGRNYLAPLVYAAGAACIGVGLAEAGWTRWFPWSMQIALAGMSILPALELPALVPASWALSGLVFVAGAAAVVLAVDRLDAGV
jgi:hypothetical protein